MQRSALLLCVVNSIKIIKFLFPCIAASRKKATLQTIYFVAHFIKKYAKTNVLSSINFKFNEYPIYKMLQQTMYKIGNKK